MAIIRPSLKFEGSELNLNPTAAPYIKDGVRRAVFNKSTNQEGAYLYFLPSYRVDNAGNGVWYKKISVRDNFGVNFKEKYVVLNRSEDPAEYFANHFKELYKEEARITETEVNGKKFKKYPAYGRLTERVLYNVAFAQNLALGAHILDLPLRNGADTLMIWVEGKDISGNPRPAINEPDRCLPVFVKLKENSQNPWTIQVESSQPVQLPLQLADCDYLYNLDEILVTKSKDEIISKLREMYPSDVFEDCMDGYSGLTKKAVQGARLPTANVQARPANPPAAPMNIEIAKPTMSASAPVMDIPRAMPAMAAPIAVPIAPVNPPPAADLSQLPPNPMMSGRLSKEDALRFISED